MMIFIIVFHAATPLLRVMMRFIAADAPFRFFKMRLQRAALLMLYDEADVTIRYAHYRSSRRRRLFTLLLILFHAAMILC